VSFDHPVEAVGPGTPAGTVLRRHWQPVAVAHDLGPGATAPVRVLGEDLTLFRSEAGGLHAVGPRCSHRGIALHHGTVEGDRLRCFYHGWCFDGGGRCVERPAERSDRDPAVDVASWPVEEYADLVWVHLGEGPPPPLPRYPELDAPGIVPIGDIRPPGPWPINWFQAVENHVDPVHLSFVHRATEPYAREVPEVSVERTDDGLAVTAVRSTGPRTTRLHFPSCIQVPMRHIVDDVTELQFFNWAVPVDDDHTAFVATTAVPEAVVDSVREDLAGRSMPAEAGPDLLAGRRRPTSVTEEDYVALVGQGTVVDRTAERLGRSDVAVIAFRRLWQEALASAGVDD
jgi:phenylpropionate dioxygenase-like ring-hydroxylating dioxygenase large terminal subunit